MESVSPLEDFVIWPPHEAFYINAMLFNTTQALKAAKNIESVISQIKDNVENLQQLELDTSACLDEVQSIAIHAAALSKYFWPVGKRYRTRGEYLRGRLHVATGSPLEDRNLRNQLEHLDENLDDYFREQVFSGYVIPEFFGPEPNRDGPKAIFFRAYFINTGEFEVLGKKYAMPALVLEVARIHELLQQMDAQGGRL
ncbi:hypothetical protein A7D16_10675 [Xanthomonas nasturtii]|uniref:hypothetical protein n=1 Tax=Xanthomonas nasturtii TaxID=1843581 RepID=UPI0007E414FE|nr:hypothetical protein [Xanthomonas nasturtii]OAX88601.1 hypothetical protein A7D16_10675 [Xanthomonas nasturtii]WVL56892.1 hypothetical protein M3O54_000640 [Xanthomonas nasturtii]